MTRLIDAVLDDDVERVRALVAEGVDVEERQAHSPEPGVMLGGMRARDVAYHAYQRERREVLAAICDELGIDAATHLLVEHLRTAPRGPGGMLEVVRRLAPGRDDEPEVESLIRDSRTFASSEALVSLLVPEDALFPLELAGQWASFQSEGYLDTPETRDDGFIDRLDVRSDGTFELERADETVVAGRWTKSPLSFSSEDAEIDADWIPTMPVLVLSIDGEEVAFASEPLLSELSAVADAYYAED